MHDDSTRRQRSIRVKTELIRDKLEERKKLQKENDLLNSIATCRYNNLGCVSAERNSRELAIKKTFLETIPFSI
ncbi:hypothetical protein CEXT_519271 [Caerostris extrusa]|uniref:Uncharacterized protein n=1 Tax=Caerostris extrusa TaxID=172846 RepID=A0AAV4TDX4_CAEEX|nr:hypothetical protein CEXT_519271 [Caerostris extrusa]